VSDQHIGVRRRPSRVPVRRIVPLVAGLAAVAWALALGEPSHNPDTAPSPVAVVPTWTGPPTVDIPGVLADGAAYAPRLFVTPEASVGVATGADGSVRLILARTPGSFTQLRDVPANALISGFAVDGDALVWMETTAGAGGGPVTTLWRASVAGTTPPTKVTTNTGQTNFDGLPATVIVADGRVTWTALLTGRTVRTEVRSVPLGGGQVGATRVDGELLLTNPPWAMSLPGGLGTPVTLRNITTGEEVTFATAPDESAVCDPSWCRVAVAGGSGLVGVDLVRPDGTERRRIAGPEATPTIGEPVLLGRFVPLATERPDGLGLSLYDLTTGETELLAPRAGNVGGHGGILWWSTGVGTELTWHALDLSRLP